MSNKKQIFKISFYFSIIVIIMYVLNSITEYKKSEMLEIYSKKLHQEFSLTIKDIHEGLYLEYKNILGNKLLENVKNNTYQNLHYDVQLINEDEVKEIPKDIKYTYEIINGKIFISGVFPLNDSGIQSALKIKTSIEKLQEDLYLRFKKKTILLLEANYINNNVTNKEIEANFRMLPLGKYLYKTDELLIEQKFENIEFKEYQTKQKKLFSTDDKYFTYIIPLFDKDMKSVGDLVLIEEKDKEDIITIVKSLEDNNKFVTMLNLLLIFVISLMTY